MKETTKQLEEQSRQLQETTKHKYLDIYRELYKDGIISKEKYKELILK
jgi:hypothetical protein